MTRSTIRVRAGLASLILVAGFSALAVAATPASAAGTTRYVATNGDDTENDCTDSTKPCEHVQYAVDQAADGDTVQIAKGEYPESVRIRKALTLLGAGSTGSGQTVIDGDHDGDASVTIDGRDVNATVAVTIKDVAVDNNPDSDGIDVEGDATLDLIDSSSSKNHGFGLILEDETAALAATVTGSTLSDNFSTGVLVTAGQLHVSNSVLNNNGSSDNRLTGFIGAGIAVLGGAATVDGSTLDANEGPGVYVFRAAEGLRGVARAADTFVPNVTAAITGSTLSNNGLIGLAVGPGAASTLDRSTLAGNAGAGIYAQQSSTVVTNSTINGTKPVTGKDEPLVQVGGVVYLASAPTPAVRSAATRAGLFSAEVPSRLASAKTDVTAPPVTAGVSLTGTIVAKNTTLADCNGGVIDGGYNLSSDAANSCKFTAAKHDQVMTDPLLGPLADNGGPTQTEILKKLSPAIDAIPAGQANCSTSALDQRGIHRPQPTGGKCDVGAVELKANKLAIHPNSLPNGKVGKSYHTTITATGGQYPIYTFAFVSGSLPDGLTMNTHGKISGTPTKAGTFHFTVSVNDPVFKDYTIVITDVAPNGSGSEPVSNTGVHTETMLAVGGGAVFAGFLLLLYVGKLDRRARGPRMVYGRHQKK